MGIKERRDRERQELGQAILAAAREIAAGEGWQAVTIRRVAERIEYSPPTIDEHFASKEAILADLHARGPPDAARRDPGGAARRRPSQRTDRGRPRLLGVRLDAYPELYQVMHGLGGVPFCAEDAAKASGVPLLEAEALAQATAQLIQMLPTMAEASAAELDDNVHMIWATAHGLAALTMAGRIQSDQDTGAALDRPGYARFPGGVWRHHIIFSFLT